MFLLKLGGLCFVVFLVYCRNAKAIDAPISVDFDLEVEDDSTIDEEAEREMASISDENLKEAKSDLKLDSKAQKEEQDVFRLDGMQDLEDRILEELDSLTDEDDQEVEEAMEDVQENEMEDLEEYDDQHFMKKRDTRVFFMENLLRDILANYDVEDDDSESARMKRKCSTFVKPTTNAKTTCGRTTTMFGKIKWCHIQCNTGYKLKHAYPQYELCGKATKYRWTYELRGLQSGTERCIAGTGTTTNASSNVCTTKECFSTAAYYMNKIDFSVNPCNNFFDFVCGRWLKENPIPPSKSHFLTYTTIRDRVIYDIADLLNLPNKLTDCSAVQKAKVAYKACMNTALINLLDANPLMKFLEKKLAWPIIDPTWDPNTLFVDKTVAELRGLYNNQVLLKVVVRKQNGVHVLQTWKGKMALPFAYYLEERYADKLSAYYDLMRDTALMLGGDRETVDWDVRDVKIFEKKLAYHKAYDWDYYTSMTLKQMQDEIPGELNWLTTFKLMILSHPISESTVVQVWNVNYLKNLQVLIKEAGKRTVQNYMMWRIVKHRIKNLSLRFQKRYLRYEEAMVGKRSLPTRKYKCADNMIYTMKGATSKLFIDKYFSPAKKKAALRLFNFIRKGFIHLLDSEVTWMDKATKDYAKRKALAITADIGYNPKLYKNTTYLDEQVSHLKVEKWDYFGNTLRILTSIAQDKFKLIGKPYNASIDAFTTRPSMVNAFYSPTHNRITLPAGEMQYPFYWGDKFPSMFQFGAIGTILGHELTHGFDNTGRQYDLYGHLNNWWSAASLAQFKQRTSCMVHQYSNFFSESAGMNLNGAQELGENIADNGGIRESFKGYHLWLKSKGLTGEQIEPTTGFTNDQMFFVGFANVRCGKATHAGAVHSIVKDVHSPGRFRVIGSLQNFAQFSKTFNCPSGSYMNPVKKCIIW